MTDHIIPDERLRQIVAEEVDKLKSAGSLTLEKIADSLTVRITEELENKDRSND